MNDVETRGLNPGDIVRRKSNGHRLFVTQVDDGAGELWVWDYDDSVARIVPGWAVELEQRKENTDGRLG